MAELVANFILNQNNNVNAMFDLSEPENFDALFQINATPTKVSQLENDLGYQTAEQVQEALSDATIDIQEDLTALDNRITNEVETLNLTITDEVNTINNRIDNEVQTINTELATKITDVQGIGVIAANKSENIVTVKSVNFVFEQGIASDRWVIVHNLGKKPNVILNDSAGTEFKARIEYDSLNQCTVFINGSTTGIAFLN